MSFPIRPGIARGWTAKLDTEPQTVRFTRLRQGRIDRGNVRGVPVSHAGIQPAVIGNQAAYLAGWCKQLKQDKKLVISAAGQAQRAADWIRGERGQSD